MPFKKTKVFKRKRLKSKYQRFERLNLSKSQKRHLSEYGELHPSEISETTCKFSKVGDLSHKTNFLQEDVVLSSSDDEAKTPFQHLFTEAVEAGDFRSSDNGTSDSDDSPKSAFNDKSCKESSKDVHTNTLNRVAVSVYNDSPSVDYCDKDGNTNLNNTKLRCDSNISDVTHDTGDVSSFLSTATSKCNPSNLSEKQHHHHDYVTDGSFVGFSKSQTPGSIFTSSPSQSQDGSNLDVVIGMTSSPNVETGGSDDVAAFSAKLDYPVSVHRSSESQDTDCESLDERSFAVSDTDGSRIKKSASGFSDKENTTDISDREDAVFDDSHREEKLTEQDHFSKHFEHDIPSELMEKLSACDTFAATPTKLCFLGHGQILCKEKSCTPSLETAEKDLIKLGVKHKIAQEVPSTNVDLCGVRLKGTDALTRLQHGLFSVMNCYQDLFYPRASFDRFEEIRFTYSLHAINHILKTRSRVIAHNAKLKNMAGGYEADYRDQGLTRAKVLVVVPTRHAAYRIVKIISKLICGSNQMVVSSQTRFKAEFGDAGHDDNRKGLKPADFDVLFAGNSSDDFRIGISVSKKSLRLYSPFSMSDIVIADPLGLVHAIGHVHHKEKDFDFLSSIEILILDQADFLLMQNWANVLHVIESMHQQPAHSHLNVDYSRTRLWALQGWAKHYRQTIIFSSVLLPPILNIANRFCHNTYYAGKVQVYPKCSSGSTCYVVAGIPQVYHRFHCDDILDNRHARFQYFLKETIPVRLACLHIIDYYLGVIVSYSPPRVEEVLPLCIAKKMTQTLIYISDYFEYCRLRNHFSAEMLSFAHISEYAPANELMAARRSFKRRKVDFLLYTERVHFYRRFLLIAAVLECPDEGRITVGCWIFVLIWEAFLWFKLRGPRHVVFYDLPKFPHFYSEVVNLLDDPRHPLPAAERRTVTVIYSAFDVFRLRLIVGHNRASKMLKSAKSIHMIHSN